MAGAARHSASATRWAAQLGPPLVVAVTLAASPLFDAPLADWHYLPFAVSLLLFGLPHGAVDHLVMADIAGERWWSPKGLAAIAGYLVLAACVFVVWFFNPSMMFVMFIALTWLHWGQGEVWYMASHHSGQPRSALLRALGLFVRGALPMLLPFLAFPEVYLGVADQLAMLFNSSPSEMLRAFASWQARGALGAGFVAVSIGYLALSWRRSPTHSAWLVDAGEIALLTAFFLMVPPILSVGLFFCLWHAPRHMVRLAADLGHADEERAVDWRALGQVFLKSAPLTLVSLAILVGLSIWLDVDPSEPGSALAVYLTLIAAVTFPHVLVVTAMDARGGLFSGDP